MVCNCNQENTIQITAGCSKTLTFNFDSDLDGLSAEFCVRAELDKTPVLTKTISDLSGKSFDLELTPTDTSVFPFSDDNYADRYIWGLDVYDTTTRTAVFPQTGENPPSLIVFRHVVG